MDKKGFTLIEIIVTIALIALVGTISVVSFMRLSERAKMREYNKIVAEFEAAAESYLSNDKREDEGGQKEKGITELFNGSIGSIKLFLSQLAEANLIDEKIKNPKTNKNFNMEDEWVVVSLDTNKSLKSEYMGKESSKLVVNCSGKICYYFQKRDNPSNTKESEFVYSYLTTYPEGKSKVDINYSNRIANKVKCDILEDQRTERGYPVSCIYPYDYSKNEAADDANNYDFEVSYRNNLEGNFEYLTDDNKNTREMTVEVAGDYSIELNGSVGALRSNPQKKAGKPGNGAKIEAFLTLKENDMVKVVPGGNEGKYGGGKSCNNTITYAGGDSSNIYVKRSVANGGTGAYELVYAAAGGGGGLGGKPGTSSDEKTANSSKAIDFEISYPTQERKVVKGNDGTPTHGGGGGTCYDFCASGGDYNSCLTGKPSTCKGGYEDDKKRCKTYSAWKTVKTTHPKKCKKVTNKYSRNVCTVRYKLKRYSCSQYRRGSACSCSYYNNCRYKLNYSYYWGGQSCKEFFSSCSQNIFSCNGGNVGKTYAKCNYAPGGGAVGGLFDNDINVTQDGVSQIALSSGINTRCTKKCYRNSWWSYSRRPACGCAVRNRCYAAGCQYYSYRSYSIKENRCNKPGTTTSTRYTCERTSYKKQRQTRTCKVYYQKYNSCLTGKPSTCKGGYNKCTQWGAEKTSIGSYGGANFIASDDTLKKYGASTDQVDESTGSNPKTGNIIINYEGSKDDDE